MLRARYAATFEAYAEVFTAAVLDEARAITGLSVPVEVKAESDPEATWWDDPADTLNPTHGDDVLMWYLWEAARRRTPLPTTLVDVDERPSSIYDD